MHQKFERRHHELLHKPVLERLCICIFVLAAALLAAVVVEEGLAALAADFGLGPATAIATVLLLLMVFLHSRWVLGG